MIPNASKPEKAPDKVADEMEADIL